MLPAWVEAIILGIVQGLTEFIPVSSSGHLVLLPYLLGWEDSSLAFDVMLHLGTLGAVLLYFRVELLAIARGVIGVDRSARGRLHRRLGWLIVLANVPVGIVGLTLADAVEEAFAAPLLASTMLLVTAALLVGGERLRARRVDRALAPAEATAPAGAPAPSDAVPSGSWGGDWRAAGSTPESRPDQAAAPPAGFPLGEDPADPDGLDLAGVSLRHAVVVGLMQCLAVLPGVSRSGATITGGVASGLTREAATRFSFLMVIPALVGATVLSIPDLGEGGETTVEIVAGTVAAFFSGYLAIRFLVALVSRHRLTGFAVYCVCIAVLGMVGYAMLGPISTA